MSQRPSEKLKYQRGPVTYMGQEGTGLRPFFFSAFDPATCSLESQEQEQRWSLASCEESAVRATGERNGEDAS